MINIDCISHVDNGLPLCALCHRNFDDHNNPGFVFLPTDISFFRTFEERDIARRREHYRRHRIRVKRICPSHDDYRQCQLARSLISEDDSGGTYDRFVLRDYFPKLGCCDTSRSMRTGRLLPAATWHGDPMAALRRGFGILGSVTIIGVLPKEIRRQLQELQNLYLENEESFMAEDEFGDETDTDPGAISVGGPQSACHTTDSAQPVSENDSQDSLPPSGLPTAKQYRSAQIADSERSIPSLGAPSLASSATTYSESWQKQDYPTYGPAEHGDWKWGPLNTAQDASKFYEDVRSHTQRL